MKRITMVIAALAVGSYAWAQEAPQTGVDDAPEPPPLPPKVTSGEQLDAPVTISIDEQGQIIEEYRQDGVIYMVRVIPENLPPYYLYMDPHFDEPMDDSQAPIDPVHWRIAEWD